MKKKKAVSSVVKVGKNISNLSIGYKKSKADVRLGAQSKLCKLVLSCAVRDIKPRRPFLAYVVEQDSSLSLVLAGPQQPRAIMHVKSGDLISMSEAVVEKKNRAQQPRKAEKKKKTRLYEVGIRIASSTCSVFKARAKTTAEGLAIEGKTELLPYRFIKKMSSLETTMNPDQYHLYEIKAMIPRVVSLKVYGHKEDDKLICDAPVIQKLMDKWPIEYVLRVIKSK